MSAKLSKMPQDAAADTIQEAVECLKKGDLVAFPTETVYGLGADAANARALEKLYKVKGRPAAHPVIVHIASQEQLHNWAKHVPEAAIKLADAFWPGPLTLILERAPHVLDAVTGGQDTVGLRIPGHPIALNLLRQFQGGVAAPSANRFGRLSPTTADDVRKEFAGEVSAVLDGGPCAVGIESTIIDLTAERPRILRPGMILKEQIEGVLKERVYDSLGISPGSVTRAPGSLKSHYAPKTPLQVLEFAELVSLVQDAIASSEKRYVVLSFRQYPGAHCPIPWVVLEGNAVECARHLYANLRKMDTLSADCILFEKPPASSEWTGINDRLARACAK